MKNILNVALILGVLVLFGGCSNDNPTNTPLPDGTGRVIGRITENGQGVSGVTVRAGSYSAVSNSSGRFVLDAMEPGSYTITPTLKDYSFTPISLTVTVREGETDLGEAFTARKSSGGGNSNQIMPLADGNSWTTRRVIYYEDGTPYDEGDIITSQLYSTTYLGEQCYSFGDDSYFRNRPDGLWTVAERPKEWRIIFKYPAAPGERYPWPFDNDAVNPPNNCTVESISTSVTVPAGTFTCVVYAVYSAYSGDLRDRYYIAPGVGWVKTERYYDGRVYSRSELLSYKLN